MSSKKNLVFVMSLVLMAINEALGKPLDDGTMQNFLIGAGTFLVARGVADHGAGGSVRRGHIAFTLGQQMLAALKNQPVGVAVSQSGNEFQLSPIEEDPDEDSKG